MTLPMTRPTDLHPETRPAVAFRDLAPDRCRAFLPNEEGAAGLCCGKRVVGGDGFLAESYCAGHRAGFVTRVSRHR
jgi:hypothetical protein